MPTISRKFTHTCTAHTAVTTKVKNHQQTETVTGGYVYKEASQFFFEDLKTMLEQTSIPVTFSEEYTYATNTLCPYFEMFGLQFPVFIWNANYYHTQYGYANFSMVPIITRTGARDPWNEIKTVQSWASNSNVLGYNIQSSICASYLSRLELEYTINIVYGDNWIVASYTAYSGVKFPLFSLIKGKDINNKEVVYVSANPNACFANRTQSATAGATYHHLVWTENWYFHEYNGYTDIPNNDSLRSYSSHPNYNNNVFLKLSQPDTIAGITVSDNKIQLMEPICCGNRVFFDNMYVVPDTVNADAYYTINNELYYCPGDYMVQNDIQYNAATMTTHACRFLLKMESQS